MYIIFSDVDGTIYKYGPKTLELRTVEDIKLAQSHGIEFILVTGNAHLSAVISLAQTLDVRFLITSSGATIFDFKTNQFIRNLFLNASVIEKVIEKAREAKVSILSWNHKHLFYEDNAAMRIKNIVRQTIAFKEPLKKLAKNDSKLIKIICFGSENKIEKLFKDFKKMGFNTLKLRPNALEISPENVSKGEAVTFMTNYLKTSFEYVMTIGDGLIDKSMLSLPVFSYALANAPTEVKQVAKYHSASVEQNGLRMAIIDFLYRNKLE